MATPSAILVSACHYPEYVSDGPWEGLVFSSIFMFSLFESLACLVLISCSIADFALACTRRKDFAVDLERKILRAASRFPFVLTESRR